METNNTTTSNGVHNAHAKDNAAKIVFGDPVLCAQFLKGYTDIPLFKEIKPEDIENVSSHFLPLFQESRDSDTVNKIRIGNSEIYLIALIEHQSENDFDMSFRILRYIVFIWTDYAAQQEKLHKGITKSKAFLYPPILPIVYYEGTSTWSAPKSPMISEYVDHYTFSTGFIIHFPPISVSRPPTLRPGNAGGPCGVLWKTSPIAAHGSTAWPT